MFDSEELEGFLTAYHPDVQKMALESRVRLANIVGPAHEFVFDATSAVCVAFGFTTKWQKAFVNIAVYPKHVTLVFPWGVELNDPEKRLKGEGKQVRNIRLVPPEILDDPYIVELINQAATRAARPEVVEEFKKYIKVYDGPKRR
jgi:hypothetical protein